MGNAAAKLIDETELVVGTVGDDSGKFIVKALLSTSDGTGITKIKNNGKTWVRYEDANADEAETLLWKTVSVGWMKSHSVVLDSTEKPIAVIITEKKGMTWCTNFVCRDVPSFDGQEPLDEEELKKAGFKNGLNALGEKVVIYKFAKLETTRTLTTAKCSYGLVKGAAETPVEALYEGEKLSSLGFKAIFKEAANGNAVAKAYTPGMTMKPHVDAASGTDLLAIVCMGYALAGDESSAGALAGAGVY